MTLTDSAPLKTIRVLLVDDDPLIGSLVRPALEREGLICERAGTIADARLAFAQRPPHLVLLDIHLPDGNGFDFCKELRSRPEQSSVPIIFLTRRGDEESRLKGFAVGGQDYITKPFSVGEVVARLRVHLAFARTEDAPAPKGDAAAATERLRQDIADMVVHDLRSPLTTVKATLELLKETGVLAGHELERIVGNAQGAVSQILLMVGDLLDMNSPHLHPHLATLDAAEVVRNVADLVTPQALHRGQKLLVKTPPGAIRLLSDERLLFRILTNLATNAVKYSSHRTEVELFADRKGRIVRFEVLDRGPGIPPEELETVFELRARGQAGQKQSVAGHGIGLAFCRKAALALKGKIWAQARDGGGSAFILELPDIDSLPQEQLDREEKALRDDFVADARWQTDGAIAQLERCSGTFDAQRIKKLGTLGHQVSGTAGTFGFSEAGAAAQALERLCADSSGDPAFIERALGLLRRIRRALPAKGEGPG